MMTSKERKISILCEDQAKMGFSDKIFLAQHGFSVFVEADQRILFDMGATDVFIHNAGLLGIDLKTADWIVLSHGHWDHTDGMKAFYTENIKKIKLLVHPGAFVDRRNAFGQYNGMFYSQEETARKFDLIQSRNSYQLSNHVYFLGQIPRINDFESRKTTFFYFNEGDKLQDFILDDTALAIKTKKGLVIITGCSHAGICNIVEYAKQVTRQSKVFAVLGGFHLLGDPVQLQKTIEYFSKNKVEHLYPMHCTDLSSLSKFHETFGIKKLCAGDTVTLHN